MKMGAGEAGSPSRTVIFGFEASACAPLEEALRVRARISKRDDLERRDSTTAPPCLPVAPVIRIFLAAAMIACRK